VLSALLAENDETITDYSYSAIIDGIRNNSWPWLPNKQCGSWYLPPPTNESAATTTQKTTEVYFKSTDGHVGTYAISLKRLNLPLLEVLNQNQNNGGCFLVDSSVRKILPDSFSRTIPIWCSVINRLVLKYRVELSGLENDNSISYHDDNADWDTRLYTPACIISPEEHLEISNLIDSRVELLYQSKAIVDPRRLVRIMTKPVRAVWVANGSVQHDTIPCSSSSSNDSVKFFTIVCCNPSYYHEGSSSKNHIHWMNTSGDDDDGDVSSTSSTKISSRGYYYTPGAADDDATWGRRLSSELFWANREKVLDPSLTEDETDAMIDSIVNEWQLHQHGGIDGMDDSKSTMNNTHQIGNLNLWIGSWRAGHPPECWDSFDAILNVTENEYPNINQSIKERQERFHETCYYFQLPVAEGKKDKTELERWMPVGLVFLMKHLQQKRRVLVHCDEGRDRSVGIVLAFVALVCTHVSPLRLRSEFDSLDVECIADFAEIDTDIDSGTDAEEDSDLHLQSGLSSSLVNILSKEKGRDIFLKWMHQQLNAPLNKPFANKESLRIVLHLVSQDRENAEPTRATMQKLNRFFMSSPLYRSIE